MRHTPSSSSSHRAASSSWLEKKTAGKVHFEQGQYEEALSCYRAALNPEYNCPSTERQIILSNVVACRLKLGGPAQARAAVEDAKQCVALNDHWAKSHIRLASAYIALGGHSNDACNAFQRALQLDPGNATARQMLMKELRRDRVPATEQPQQPQPNAPPQDQDDTFSSPVWNMPHSTTHFPSDENNNRQQQQQQQQQQQHGQDHSQPSDNDRHNNMNIDDSLPVLERAKLYYMRAISWYSAQSDTIQSLFQVALTLLILYVLFGGRFGLGYLVSTRSKHHQTSTTKTWQYEVRVGYNRDYPKARSGGRGNYQPGNAYDRFYHRDSRQSWQQKQQQQQGNRQASATGRDGTYEYSHNTGSFDNPYQPRSTNHHGRGTSFSLWETSNLWTVIILLGLSYGCFRMGMNPIHILMMVNMVTLRQGYGGFRRMYGGMGYGGFPRAWWGGGGGFARPRNGW